MYNGLYNGLPKGLLQIYPASAGLSTGLSVGNVGPDEKLLPPNLILLSDDFAGVTIDANKWFDFQLNAGQTITQNNELIIANTGTGPAAQLTRNYLRSLIDYSLKTTKVMAFDINLNPGNTLDYFAGFRKLGTTNSVTDMLGIRLRTGATVGFRFQIFNNDIQYINVAVAAPGFWAGTYSRLKILLSGTNVIISRYLSGGWQIVYSGSINITFNTAFVFFSEAISAAGTETIKFQRFRLTNYDYTTELP